ncbi:glycosyltransferase family 4 protein [Shewanella corallii]|uniref:Glycosyltransferase family 4 protein n=1 Tax=Shewanella corallii TaxID=560080 RepID=A0ABT0N7G6_9GAMM|nr:glycosyltransferase family 4 protein [Shewanella corallii]MCL2914035.1 glycosyltransferase family 4 protein [Shewanella corallii]
MKQQVNNNQVMLLLDSRSHGGIETHVLELATGLSASGQRVSVCFLCRYDQPHPLQDLLERQKIPVNYFDGTLSSTLTHIKSTNPEVLHTHGYKAGIIGRIAALLLKKRVISTFHAGEIGSGKLRFYDWLDRYTAFLADKRLAVSPDIAARIPFTRVELVRNFINTRALVTSQGKQIAFVGRLSAEKGPDRMLDYARALPHLSFHIYGDGPERARLEQSAPGNVTFYGFCNMEEHWCDIGLLVMPSRYEGMPLAALEALGRGIPVAATRVGAMEQLINNGCNGYLVEEANHKLLSAAINTWHSLTEENRHEISQAAIETVERGFSVDAVLPSILKDYRKTA